MNGSEKGAVRQRELKDDYYKRIEGWVHRRIAREFHLANANAIVDVGCGDCRLARFLATSGDGRRVTGIDVADNGFPRTASFGERLRCMKADARSLPSLRTGAFDAAVSLYSLHEMQARLTCLREVWRVLRPDGELLAVDFPSGSLAQRLWNEPYLTTAEVAVALRRTGFVRVSAKRIARRQLTWAKGYKPRRGRAPR